MTKIDEGFVTKISNSNNIYEILMGFQTMVNEVRRLEQVTLNCIKKIKPDFTANDDPETLIEGIIK